MSATEGLIDSWWHTHAAKECEAREARDGTKCPFCQCKRDGVSLCDLMES